MPLWKIGSQRLDLSTARSNSGQSKSAALGYARDSQRIALGLFVEQYQCERGAGGLELQVLMPPVGQRDALHSMLLGGRIVVRLVAARSLGCGSTLLRLLLANTR
jgi:hypothetical protein